MQLQVAMNFESNRDYAAGREDNGINSTCSRIFQGAQHRDGQDTFGHNWLVKIDDPCNS